MLIIKLAQFIMKGDNDPKINQKLQKIENFHLSKVKENQRRKAIF